MSNAQPRGSWIEYDTIVQPNVMVPMRDGVRLATDLYFPAHDGRIAPGRYPVIMERTPYDKCGRHDEGLYFARRGYVAAMQDVRGRYASQGEWYAFAHEAPDGYDAVEWLAAQPWCTGKIGTIGGSYCGSDQSALATLNPPHLAAMVVAVGTSNYHTSSMRQGGALELRFMVYAFRMAATSPEAQADPALKAALERDFANIGEWLTRTPYKRGSSSLRYLPTYEGWLCDILQHGAYDDYWRQRGYAIDEYYAEHADVPTIYVGGWYDSYARGTTANFAALARIKRAPQRLLMGPWTHGGWGNSFAGDVDFGADSTLDDYNGYRLRWFDRWLKGLDTGVEREAPVRYFIMGGGDSRKDANGRLRHGGVWREASEWPLPGTRFTPYYLHAGGGLSPEPPATADPSRYTFDPREPVPTIGGGLSAAPDVLPPGAYDQRGDPRFYGCRDTLPLAARSDVLVFQTAPLERDLAIAGPLTVTLWASSSAPDTDFTAKLCDVHPANGDYPDGFVQNLPDSIIRARFREDRAREVPLEPGRPYAFKIVLYPTANRFGRGHRIRLDISSSNYPRFDINPNTGGPLGLDRRWQTAEQALYHDGEHASCV
ncbi:MAG: CocE/NonD family hydrolase, partial [Chloroflexota bacterium]